MELEKRINLIKKVLNSAEGPLSAREISTRYAPDGNPSDWLSTNHILHVMSIFKMVKRITVLKGKAIRHTYEIKRDKK